MAPNNAARGVCLFCAAAAGLWWLVVGYRSPSTGGAVFGHGGGDSDGLARASAAGGVDVATAAGGSEGPHGGEVQEAEKLAKRAALVIRHQARLSPAEHGISGSPVVFYCIIFEHVYQNDTQ